jgi:hypothetical protein
MYKTTTLCVFLYECETWSLTLRKEGRLRVFENWVLRRIFGSKMEEVAGGWRRLHNEDLHDMYTLPNIIRVNKSMRMRWTGHAARMEEMRNAYKSFFGNPEEKIPLGRSRHTWQGNV